MPSRRTFVKTAGLLPLVTAGSALAAVTAADAARPYAGPHQLPRNLTALSIKQKDGSETLGVKTKAGVIDVAAASRLLEISAPLTLEDLLRAGNAAGLAALVEAALSSPRAKPALLDETSITHGRLFVNPGKIMCIGLNYRAHANEANMPIPKEPILFNKYNNALAPHNFILKLPPKDISYKFDYETELLVVIGKNCRNVSEAEALDYVAGYCIGHDFSARDLQLEKGGQWMIGKTLDDFAPIGPYFVSADIVGDPNDLNIETRVNGEVRQSATTRDLIFNCQKLISYISRLWALEPGDLIFTGTPPGVIIGMQKDKQVWLKPGDKIESSIEKLGELKFELA
jgi:2-keto-4-pentenoate hydratase/2-oxohepta-3-ene-1,7-dioic acid hydratase in catechol pathway